MAIFKRRGAVTDLTRRAPSSCPRCGEPGTTAYVDLVLQKASHTCGRCASLWETMLEHATGSRSAP